MGHLLFFSPSVLSADQHLTSQQAEGTWIHCYIQGIELPRSLWGFCLVGLGFFVNTRIAAFKVAT